MSYIAFPIEISPEDPQKMNNRIKAVRKESLKHWTTNFNQTTSAYDLPVASHQDSFCSVTISWYNPFLRYFQTFSCLFTTVCLFLAPYMFFFQSSEEIFLLNTVCDMVYLLVVLFRSRTSHMTDGVEEKNLLKVRKRYHTSFAFVLDLITYLPVIQYVWPAPGTNHILYAFYRQTIFIRLHYILFYLGIREKESGSSTLLYRSTKFVLLSTLTIHIAACGWYGLACSRTEDTKFSLDFCHKKSWIMYLPQNVETKVNNAKQGELTTNTNEVSFLHNTYITSLYWSSSTVTSTGYGDIHAYTIGEKVFSIFAMVIGLAIIYGMTMGGMTSMLTNIDARRSDFVHRYQAFQREVKRMKTSDSVKELCLQYIDYLWHRWEGHDIHSSQFLKILPESLRANFAEARFKKFLQKADLLDGTEEAFRRNLSMVSHPMVFLESQFLQKSGEIPNTMFYIQNGIVEVLDEEEEEVVALMHSGKLIGQIMLVFDLPRINSIRCRTNCDIFILTKLDFLNVLSQYPQSASKFIDATQHKCDITKNVCPLQAPSIKDLDSYFQITHDHHDHLTAIDHLEPSSSLQIPHESPRRISTIFSSDYQGVALSRVALHRRSEQERNLLEKRSIQGPKPSLVDFLLHGNKPQGRMQRRSSSMLHDGTQVIATDVNYAELKDAVGAGAHYEDLNRSTWRDRLFALTIVNPRGAFYQFWLTYLFFISLFAGLYTTFIAFFTTTPGEPSIYMNRGNDDLYGRTLLDMATDSCNATQNALYYKCPPWPFNATVECLKKTGGSFAWRISGNSSAGYRIKLPSRYNISQCVYGDYWNNSPIHIFLSTFFIDFSFYLNILINFRTKVLTPNGFLTSFKDIATNYNKWHGVYIDVLGCFPFELFSNFFGCYRIVPHHAEAFLRLNRVIYFFRYVPSTFSRWEYSLNVKIVRIRSIKIIVYIYTFTHICSCFFFWWSCGYVMQSNVEKIQYKCRFGSWGWVFDVSFSTGFMDDYIKTIYWATTTMTSTGYGDVSASTTTGRIFALSTMIIGTLMYGWLVAVIASTVTNSDSAKVRFKNSLLDTKNYLLVHSVPVGLVDRVEKVRCIEWERYAGTAVPGKVTIGKDLSKELHNVLFYETFHKFIGGLPFFYGVDSSFISSLCNHVMVYHYSEGDIVIYEGDLSRNLYIVKYGHCDVVSDNLEEIITHFSPGDYFGECELLFGCGSPSTVVADTACELLVLQRDDIDHVLQTFPVLERQMSLIEKDTAYMNQLLTTIGKRKATGENISMKERYKIETIDGSVLMYTNRIKNRSVFLPLSDCDRKLIESFGSIFLLSCTFDPSNSAYLVYQSIIAILAYLNIFIVPIQFAFWPKSLFLMLLQYTLDTVCLVDQYVKAHTSYFNEQAVLVRHPIRTASRYLRSSFAVDFISWFPFELIVYGALSGPLCEQQWRMITLFRVARLLQGYKVMGYFSYWLSGIHEMNRWIKYARNFLFGMALHHWCSCLLFITACSPESMNNEELYETMSDMVVLNGTGSNTYCHNTTWVGRLVSSNTFPALDIVSSVMDQYVISLYWSTATFVCVGYGDINASRTAEMVLATIAMVCGTVFYSYILGVMSADVQTDDIRRAKYKSRLADIKKFFKIYDVSKETEKQVLDYYSYLWDRTRGVSPDRLFTGLPPSLKTSVCQCMYGPMIREAFGEGETLDKETQGFFRLLSTHITPSLYMKHSIICKRGDIGNEMFFIQRGSVAILNDDDRTVCKILGPGQHFGEVALLFATPRMRTIRAISNCELNMLTKKDLDDILGKFPQFKDQMLEIANDRKLHGTHSRTYNRRASDAFLATALFVSDELKPDLLGKQKGIIKVLDKESKFVVAWNYVILILSVTSASLCIYQACYMNHSLVLYAIGYFIDTWFAVDMVITFHTSFVDVFGSNIDSLETIKAYYAKSLNKFALEAIANAPTELFAFFLRSSYPNKFSVFCLLRLNRTLRMYRFHCIFNEVERDIRKDTLMIRLYKSFLYIAFTINLISGVWFMLGCPLGHCSNPKAWTASNSTDYLRKGVHGHHLLPLVDSVYWTVATMTSTGYGDIKPERQIEMVYACFVMVLGKLLIGYVFGMVAATMANDESLRVWYEQNVKAVKHCMKEHKFDKKLRNHIIQYYDYMWMKNQGVNVMDLFPDLSFSLRADIYSQICLDMIESIELFGDCPSNFKRHVCMVMVPTAYMPGDYICMEGDVRAEMYIIHRGIAEAIKFIGKESVTVRVVMEGESFLCESVLCMVRRPCFLRAQTYVDVFSMNMEGLRSVLKYHPAVTPIITANAKRLYPELQI